MKKEEKRNSVLEETTTEPLSDETLETVSGGRRLDISFDVSKKSDWNNDKCGRTTLNTSYDLNNKL